MAKVAVSNADEALDLVQETMLAFVKNYASKPRNEWKPLFYRVLQNRIRDWYRKQKTRNRWLSWLPGRQEEGDSADPIQTAPDPREHSPERLNAAREDSEAMLTAIGALPQRQQQALLLRNWEGLNVKETAAAMGCSEGSVKTHLSRALNSLRTKLGELNT